MLSLSLIGNTYFNYKVGRKIGEGGFGEIYIGTHVKTGKEYALKFETLSSHNAKGEHEAHIYKKLSGIVGIPNRERCGIVEDRYYLMAMELLGPSLESLFNYCGRKFSLKTVVMMAQQLIARVHDIHSKGYMHRDLKPDNIVVGTGSNRGLLYVIDFGLTKRVKTATNHHIPYDEGKRFIGTYRYASLNAHHGRELSRRDDLESLGYTFVYLLKGKLPWQGLGCDDTDDKNRLIRRMKERTLVSTLCDGLEPEFADFICYTRDLPFTQRPDYAYLHGLFDNIAKRKGFTMDYMFDWTIKKMNEEAAARKVKETSKPKEVEEKAPPQETVCKMLPKKRKLIDIVCHHYGNIKSQRLIDHDTKLKMKKEAADIVCQYHQPQNQQSSHNKRKYDSRAEERKQALDIVRRYHEKQKQQPQHNNNHSTRSEMTKEPANIVCQYDGQHKQKKEPKQQKRKRQQRKQEQKQQQQKEQQQPPHENTDLIICEKELENNKQKCL